MKVLVTGGGGFLGKAIIKKLLERGDKVRSFSRGNYPELKKWGVDLQSGNMSDQKAVFSAVSQCDKVLHVASKPGIWGSFKEYYDTNVIGTQILIAACKYHKIRSLVYTSSPSVVFNGCNMEGVDESAPYPKEYFAHYPKTKAIAEKFVLASNGDSLATAALRPHLIWGPGDRNLIPRIIERARSGKLRIIGDGRNLVDTIYIDNAAQAHLLALDKLYPGSNIAGKVYFVSQGEPLPMADLLNRILATANFPPIQQSISSQTAYSMGYGFELIYSLLRIKSEPPMTRFLAKELSTSHWFNITAIQRDLGYIPEVSISEGLERLKVGNEF